MSTATLAKWGNSQGIIIPKTLCDALGWKIGDKIEINKTTNESVELKTTQRRFTRTQNLTIEELFEGWNGTYEAPSDFVSNGNEIEWGNPCGKELW